MDNKMVERYNSFRDVRKMTENRRYRLKTLELSTTEHKRRENKRHFILHHLFIMYWEKTLFAQVTRTKYLS